MNKFKKTSQKRNTKRWSLPNGTTPRTSKDFQLVDDQFLAWLEEHIQQSVQVLDEELKGLNLGNTRAAQVRKHLERRVLGEWVRRYIRIESILSIIVYGRRRNPNRLDRFFKRRFGVSLRARDIEARLFQAVASTHPDPSISEKESRLND